MIALIIYLVILGLALYLIETLIPLSPPIIMIIRVLIVLFAFLLILNFFGIADTSFGRIR